MCAACYSHIPAATAPSGSRIRILLSDSGTRELARYVGPRVSTINGTVERSENGGDLVLAVSSTVTNEGSETFWKGEAVAVPRPYIAVLQQRKLSVPRTAALAGGLLAGAIGLGRATGAIGSGGGKGGPPPTPQ
jgi:hypothetical protein